MIARFNDMETKDNGWVCRDVDDVPEGWNMNNYDDQTWEKAYQWYNNGAPPRWLQTDENFSYENMYIGTASWQSDHILCRYNQVSYTERVENFGLCDNELHDFTGLLNKMIDHHRFEAAQYTEKIGYQADTITSLATSMEGLQEDLKNKIEEHLNLIDSHADQIETLWDNHEEA